MALQLRMPTFLGLAPASAAPLVHIHANGAWTYSGGPEEGAWGWGDEPIVATLEA